LFPTWAEGNTIKIKNEKDEAYYCESYKSPATAGSLIKFEKCDLKNTVQKSWEWIPLTNDNIIPGKNCIKDSNLCIGIGKNGKGNLLEWTVNDESLIWSMSNDGQFFNKKTGNSQCFAVDFSDDASTTMMNCVDAKKKQPDGFIIEYN